MKVGDLVKLNSSAIDDKSIGTVLHFSLHKGQTVANILWNTGEKTWILKNNLVVIQSRAK